MIAHQYLRIILDIALSISILHGWWPIGAVLGCIGGWRYGYFAEMILAGLVYDSLFLTPGVGISSHGGLIISTGLFFATLLSKRVLRR